MTQEIARQPHAAVWQEVQSLAVWQTTVVDQQAVQVVLRLELAHDPMDHEVSAAQQITWPPRQVPGMPRVLRDQPRRGLDPAGPLLVAVMLRHVAQKMNPSLIATRPTTFRTRPTRQFRDDKVRRPPEPVAAR